MSKRRVVVTGLGIVCPVGSTRDRAWQAVLRGESGIARITRFDTSAFPVRFGGAVRNFDLEQYMTPKEARRMDPFMHYGIAAGVQAVADAGLDFDKLDSRALRRGRPASGIGGLQHHRIRARRLAGGRAAQDLAVLHPGFHHQHARRPPVDPLRPARAQISAWSRPAPRRRMRWASAMRTIQYGDADLVIAGGAEMATTPLGLGGFCQAKALSTRNDSPPPPAALGTGTATASCSATAAAP